MRLLFLFLLLFMSEISRAQDVSNQKNSEQKEKYNVLLLSRMILRLPPFRLMGTLLQKPLTSISWLQKEWNIPGLIRSILFVVHPGLH